MYELKASQLRAVFPTAPEEATRAFSDCYNRVNASRDYGFKTRENAAMWLAQVGYESGYLKNTEEQMSYSPKRLMEVWPSRFPDILTATKYANNPEKLANNVYANRLGNGSEASGDGWRYRGRGLIQLTGKNNYLKFFDFLDNKTYYSISNPDLEWVKSYYGATESSMWFFKENNLLRWTNDVSTVTSKVSGSTRTIPERRVLFNKAMAVL